MFDALSDRLGNVFDRLKGRGALKEQDVRDAMREVRIALLEADVALPVVRRFIDQVTEAAVGQNVLRSVTPGQQVVKIVNDALVEMLGGDSPAELDLAATPPVVIMMVGLQGSGKTTTTAKLGKLLKEKQGKKVLMASLDVNRPAAQEQLKVLGEQVEVATLPIVPGQMPVELATRAMQAAKLQAVDVLLLDTAGRLHVDQQLMDEMKAVEEELKATLALADGAAEKDIQNLTAVYQAMKPKDAAALFETMSPEFAAGFLGRMPPDSAAAILSGMSAEAAYGISVIVAGRNSDVPKD